MTAWCALAAEACDLAAGAWWQAAVGWPLWLATWWWP